jgi:trehalose 6-phosphate synthase/phosphatase
VFRILPWRREVLHGLLGADLVGFHTFAYLRHFAASLVHVEGIEADIDRVRVGDRTVRLGVFPMGIDTARFGALARTPDVIEEAAAIRADAGGRRILLGIDRLDYTKGIPRRLLAIERLLQQHPGLRDTIRYIQIAVPSRDRVESYQAFRRQVDEAVGRINGACATLRSMPVHYLCRSLSRRQVAALYCAADVMLVTPLRDGMNLVAKEFVASRVDGDGVLVLSEFAGAAAELADAVVVNPYDVDATSIAIGRALSMGEPERRARMARLRERVLAHDVHDWAAGFVERLSTTDATRIDMGSSQMTGQLHADIGRLRLADRLILLLDYDGTLVPIEPAPHLAVPDEGLVSLLEALGTRPGTDVHVVSGRPREFLDTWFGRLPVALWAEHGLWRRPAPGQPWEMAMDVPSGWIEGISPILEQFTAATPGSLLEIKSASVAWHYRMAHPEFGARQAHELRMLLGDALSNQPLEVLEGKKVIEVRLRGVSKALIARGVLAAGADAASILAAGDDRTDEELFAALPSTSVTVAIGPVPRGAKYWVPDCRAARDLLRAFLAHPPDDGAVLARNDALDDLG